MSNSINWDEDVWYILDSYFKNVANYLTKNQIDSDLDLLIPLA